MKKDGSGGVPPAMNGGQDVRPFMDSGPPFLGEGAFLDPFDESADLLSSLPRGSYAKREIPPNHVESGRATIFSAASSFPLRASRASPPRR